MKKKTATYNLTLAQIEAMKQEATEKAIDTAFILMLGIPAMIIHDKYSLLTRKEVDGKCREERFTDLALELFDCYNAGYVTLDDFKQILKDECGLTIKEKKRK